LLDLQAAHGLLSRPAPKIAGSPGTFEFGQIENRTLSEGRSFFILNKGLRDLQIQRITLQGPNPEDFPMGENTCRDRILPPGEMCRVGITFAPLTPGAKAAALQILSNDPEVSALEIWLSGSGVSPRTKIGFLRNRSVHPLVRGNSRGYPPGRGLAWLRVFSPGNLPPGFLVSRPERERRLGRLRRRSGWGPLLSLLWRIPGGHPGRGGLERQRDRENRDIPERGLVPRPERERGLGRLRRGYLSSQFRGNVPGYSGGG
jgi:hypothetical protein